MDIDAAHAQADAPADEVLQRLVLVVSVIVAVEEPPELELDDFAFYPDEPLRTRPQEPPVQRLMSSKREGGKVSNPAPFLHKLSSVSNNITDRYWLRILMLTRYRNIRL